MQTLKLELNCSQQTHQHENNPEEVEYSVNLEVYLQYGEAWPFNYHERILSGLATPVDLNDLELALTKTVRLLIGSEPDERAVIVAQAALELRGSPQDNASPAGFLNMVREYFNHADHKNDSHKLHTESPVWTEAAF